VTPNYDPLLAKVNARGRTRDVARRHVIKVLAAFEIVGVRSNPTVSFSLRYFLARIMA
jgi:acetyl/propionyl-CoA carboxylase alpha subunit